MLNAMRAVAAVALGKDGIPASAVKPLRTMIGTAIWAIVLMHQAMAQSVQGPERFDSQQAPSPAGILGDWGGFRTRLGDAGVDASASYVSETAWNFAGGERSLVTESGQFTLGFTGDMDRLWGLQGGTMQATMTARQGDDLGAAAGLNVLQQVQEVFGRGQTVRLTQLWYEQTFAQDTVALKLGRATISEDFDSFSCYFMNLSFCGSAPGNIVGTYWFDSPISQWTARLRYSQDNRYVQGAVYEVNPRNLENAFSFGRFNGATGVLVPIEIGLTPDTSVTSGLGHYRLGAWYSNAPGGDVFLDINHRPIALSGAEPLQRSSRYGAWFSGQQQIFGTAANGQFLSGLSVFLNLTIADRRTSPIDDQIATGLWWKGFVSSLPDDVLGIGVVRTHVNPLIARGESLDPASSPIQHSEYATEIYYSLHPFNWLEMRPNFQLIHHPGGVQDAPDIGVVGLKAGVTL